MGRGRAPAVGISSGGRNLAMSFEVGQILGDYEVLGALGAGGMGRVYKVRNLISDRVDAMKVLLPDLGLSPDLVTRFLNEIKVLAAMRHPHIAALHTALRVENQLLMVMELVDGANLDERLRSGILPLAEAVAIATQVLSALAYAHARGVVHRDIKPANIAISLDGVVKLLDFGVARSGTDRKLTMTGMVLGSLYYMSPEQVRGETADARSDLYSVGVTLYRMLTGRRPIEGESEFAVMKAQISDMPMPPQHWNAALPEPLSNTVMRALAKESEARFQSADEFRMALEPYLERDSIRPLPGPPDPWVTRTMPAVLAPGVAPGVASGLTPSPSSSQFQPAALGTLAKSLAQWTGPIATALVRKQSQASASLPELCRALSEHIPAEADRRAFLSACAREFGSQAGLMATPAPLPSWNPAALERITKTLAQYVGPLSKVLVTRAARKAKTVDELYELLGAEIPSASERTRFLASQRSSF